MTDPDPTHVRVSLTTDELAALSAIIRNGWDALGEDERAEVVGSPYISDATNAIATIRKALRANT